MQTAAYRSLLQAAGCNTIIDTNVARYGFHVVRVRYAIAGWVLGWVLVAHAGASVSLGSIVVVVVCFNGIVEELDEAVSERMLATLAPAIFSTFSIASSGPVHVSDILNIKHLGVRVHGRTRWSSIRRTDETREAVDV